MEVRHHIRSNVLVIHITFGHITVLIYLLDRTTRTPKRIGTGSVLINTRTCGNIPPVCQFEACVDGTRKTGCFVRQSIFIQNPIRIFNIILQILQTLQYAVFTTIIIQIATHLIVDRPSVNSGHCTVTALSVQTCTGQCLISTCLRIRNIGSYCQDAIFLFTIKAESRLVITSCRDNAGLMIIGTG